MFVLWNISTVLYSEERVAYLKLWDAIIPWRDLGSFISQAFASADPVKAGVTAIR